MAKAESQTYIGEVQSASSHDPQAGIPRRNLGDVTPKSSFERTPTPLLQGHELSARSWIERIEVTDSTETERFSKPEVVLED